MHLLWLSYDLELLSERHDECIISYGFHTSWNSPCYRALGATISAFSRTFAKRRWIIKNEQVTNANAKSGGGAKVARARMVHPPPPAGRRNWAAAVRCTSASFSDKRVRCANIFE